MARGLGIKQTLTALGPEAMAKTLPDGTDYELTLKRAIPGNTNGGKEKITLIFEVNVGPNFPARPGVTPVSTVGREVTTEQYWSPENATAVRIFLQTMEKLGATQEWIDGLDHEPSMEDIANRIVGVKILAGLTTDAEWSRNNVRVRKQLAPPLSVRAGGGATTNGTATTAAASAGTPVVEETLGTGTGATDEWMND